MDSDLKQVEDKSVELHEDIIKGIKLQLGKLEMIIDDMKRKLN